MVRISPRKLRGTWVAGYALDVHTVRSTYVGEDEYGHAVFDTQRSEMGDLLYALKYKGDRTVIDTIVDTVVDFIHRQKWSIELVIPVPPSRSRRSFQPVQVVARAIAAELKAVYCPECVVKVRDTRELKDVLDFKERAAILKGAFAVSRKRVFSKRVLLFDDLYRSGATLRTVAEALVEGGGVSRLFALTLTMTRRKQ
ncbi:MAG: ComF family protein [Planctomycetia bacterium]|nr:ComF family protein [Planctomycetia bacterium]